MQSALPVLLQHRKRLMLHAEVVSDDGDAVCAAGCNVRSHATWQATRPPSFEINAAKAVVAAMYKTKRAHEDLWANVTAEENAFGVHIAHLSSAEALPVYERVRTTECIGRDVQLCMSFWLRRAGLAIAHYVTECCFKAGYPA